MSLTSTEETSLGALEDWVHYIKKEGNEILTLCRVTDKYGITQAETREVQERIL